MPKVTQRVSATSSGLAPRRLASGPACAWTGARCRHVRIVQVRSRVSSPLFVRYTQEERVPSASIHHQKYLLRERSGSLECVSKSSLLPAFWSLMCKVKRDHGRLGDRLRAAPLCARNLRGQRHWYVPLECTFQLIVSLSETSLGK